MDQCLCSLLIHMLMPKRPIWRYSEMGPLGDNSGWVGSWRWGLHDGISGLIKRDQMKGHVRMQQWSGHLQSRELSLDTDPAHTLILNF